MNSFFESVYEIQILILSFFQSSADDSVNNLTLLKLDGFIGEQKGGKKFSYHYFKFYLSFSLKIL